ncbi:MAG: 2-phosphosulfolactate phosphatase [Pirellulaceae bacterium]
MEVDVILLPTLHTVRPGSVAIVIDTLRFTTTVCQALQSGAQHVCARPEIEEIRQLSENDTQENLRCGERQCKPIEGFHLGNSPLEYTRDSVEGKGLYFTTTNGTRAIESAESASEIWLAALVNRRAICEKAMQLEQKSSESSPRMEIVCAGTEGHIAFEDVLAAGAILDELTQRSEIEFGSDSAQIAWSTWRSIEAAFDNDENADRFETLLESALRSALGGIHLIETGFTSDIQFAAQLDTIDLVPSNQALETHHDWRTFTTTSPHSESAEAIQ